MPLDIEDAEAKHGLSLAEPQTPETIYEKQWALTLHDPSATDVDDEIRYLFTVMGS